MSTDIVRHVFRGNTVRVITDEGGEPWFVATDVAKILGYAAAKDMTRRLDDDEKGGRSVPTPGGQQQVIVITEAGLYAAILGSQVPGAKEFKRWVTHELLPEIRRTGSYAVPQSREERLALAVIDAQAMLADKDAVIATLAPPAAAWTAMADASGDYSLRDAAQMLSRDPAIDVGQNRLGAYLRQVGWIDKRSVPYQRHVDLGRINSRARTYRHPRTGEQMIGDPQVRITVKGLEALHKLLGGTSPLDTTERHLEVVS